MWLTVRCNNYTIILCLRDFFDLVSLLGISKLFPRDLPEIILVSAKFPLTFLGNSILGKRVDISDISTDFRIFNDDNIYCTKRSAKM